ncbi:MAG: transposase [Sphingobacterium sp.]
MKQLLTRSRHLLFKLDTNWTQSQRQQAEIYFQYYPVLEKVYRLSRKLSHIFRNTKEKGLGFTRLTQWYNDVEKSGLKTFGAVSRIIQNPYRTI